MTTFETDSSTTLSASDSQPRFRPKEPAKPDLSPFRVIHSAMRWLPRTQTWMFNQAQALPGNIENHVVCETTENLDVFGMKNLHCLADGSPLGYAWDKIMRGCRLRHHLGHLPKVAKAIGSHLLHSHFGHLGWANLAAARRMRGAHVVTFYGQDLTYLPSVDPRWLERYRQMFAEVDVVLCEGPFMASKVVELGCRRDRVRVHHLGVDVEGLRFAPRTRASNEPLRVLIAGSFTEKKGIPDALRALGRIRDDVDFQVTLIGDASAAPRNQAEKRRIQVAIDEYDLRDRVELLGYQSHTALMAAAYEHHVFLSPSVHAEDGDTEGGAPVTILEMAATGMPVVSTRHCDIPSVVIDGQTGLLADERDVDGIAEHLRTIAAHPERWPAMGEAARRHVEAEYDMRSQGEALAAIYRSL
jgi:colanic acid/amylovoran/stewartan biosynthesis glycosyltransferase WcaL/AmsK/CpsK